MFNEQQLATFKSMLSLKVSEVYSADIMRDTLKLFVIEHEDDLTSWGVAYNCTEMDVVMSLHDQKELEFGLELFPTFREAKSFFNGRVAL